MVESHSRRPDRAGKGARRGGGDDADRAPGTLEGLLSELIRRSASLGFASLLVTEEALRRAVSDRVPGEWLEFISRQGEELRREMLDRLGKEFGQWLRTQEPAALIEQILERYEVSAEIELRPREDREGAAEGPRGASLRVLARSR